MSSAVYMCRNCSSVSTKKCAGCLVARYCSRSCQKEDWRAHHRGSCVSESLARPCVSCTALTCRHCSGCVDSFTGFTPAGHRLKGRAHCSRCDNRAGVCPVCADRGISPLIDELAGGFHFDVSVPPWLPPSPSWPAAAMVEACIGADAPVATDKAALPPEGPVPPQAVARLPPNLVFPSKASAFAPVGPLLQAKAEMAESPTGP